MKPLIKPLHGRSFPSDYHDLFVLDKRPQLHQLVHSFSIISLKMFKKHDLLHDRDNFFAAFL